MNGLKPSLRFRQNDGSEFPELVEFLFKQIVSLRSLKYDPNKCSTPNTPLINLEHIESYTGRILEVSNLEGQSSLKLEFHAGDVLFGKLMPRLCKWAHPDFNGVCSSEIWVLSGKMVLNRYLYYLIQTPKFAKTAAVTSGTIMPRASWSFVASHIFPIPHKDEQLKIAKFLSAVDDRLNALRKKQILLKKFIKYLAQKIFNQKLRFKRNDGGNYTNWKLKHINDVAKIVGGGTPSSNTPQYWDGGIVWFTPTEVKQKYLCSCLRTISTEGLMRSAAKIVPPGSLLFTSRATIGDVGIATIECCTNQGFKSFVVNNKCKNEFLYYWILNNKRNFLRKASGSTYLEVSTFEIKKLPIYLPCTEEQQKIANFLSAVDLKIVQIENQIRHFEKFKRGLLQQMFV